MDIGTIALMVGVSHFLRVVVLAVQFAINRTYRGIGWWLVWSASVAIGATVVPLRAVPSLRNLSILVQNDVMVVGVIAFYVGLMRFVGGKERRVLMGFLLGGFVVSHALFLLVVDITDVRAVLFAATLAVVALLTAVDLHAVASRRIRGSAYFLVGTLAAHGLFQAFRAIAIVFGTTTRDFLAGGPFHVATFVEAFVVGTLLTFGLVLLMNQRSYAEMMEARDHFQLLFQASPDAILITREEDGVCRGANHGFESLSGYGREEIVGRSAADLGLYEVPADREETVASLRKKGAVDSLAIRFRRKDGSGFVGSLSARLLPLDGVPHILSVTRDVTEERRAEEELAWRAREIHDLNVGLEKRVAERTSELEEANRELEALVHSIAHDLRAPLRAVDGFSGLLEREQAGRLDAEGIRFLALVRGGAQRADRLIRDLVDYAGTGKAAMRTERVEMDLLVRSSYAEVADDEVRSTFRFELSPLPPALGDPDLLGTLFRLLLSNAVKFSLPRPDRWIEVSGSVRDGMAEYRVQDGGIGFDPAHAGRLFGVFEQLKGASAPEGTGIGLATAKRIVTRHGGWIRAEGTPNGGAAFSFTLPAAGGTDA